MSATAARRKKTAAATEETMCAIDARACATHPRDDGRERDDGNDACGDSETPRDERGDARD